MATIVRRSVFPFLAAVASLPAQGEVDARATVAKGASVWFVHETRHDVQIRMQGRDITTGQTTARTLHLEVRDVDANGNYLVATRLVRIHGKYLMPGQGEIEFDSAAEGGGSGLARMLAAGGGKTFVCKVDPRGQVLELGEGAEAITKDASKTGLHDLTRGALKQLVQDAFGLLPPRRTAGGAKWQAQRIEYHGRMPTAQKLELALSDVAPEAFVIEGSGTLEIAREELAADKDLPNREQSLRDLEQSKIEASKVALRQTTARSDGLVLEASSAITFDLRTRQADLGEVAMQMKVDTTLRRTSAEAAMPKAEPAKEPPKDPAKDPAKEPAPQAGGR